jgi:hypothetical protein
VVGVLLVLSTPSVATAAVGGVVHPLLVPALAVVLYNPPVGQRRTNG